VICVTGDVHHSGMQSDDLEYCRGTEIDAAHKMALIAADYNIPVTLFFTGKCLNEQPELIKKISEMDNVEVGGHNYFAFKPRKPFDYYARLTGLRNGPWLYQYWEVNKTKRKFRRVCNKEIISWRDHAYRHDKNTRKILKLNDIQLFSDVLSCYGGQPFWNEGFLDVPINTLPDHDYVFHGSRQPGTIDPNILLKTHFATYPMQKEDWLLRVKGDIQTIESVNGVSTVLAHPACMEVFDDFSTFRQLCSFLRKYKTIKMNELLL